MDGLLLDSERVALASFVAACHEFDFDPDVDVYYKCIGGNEARTKRILTEGYGKSFPYDDVDAAWQASYREQVANRPFPLKLGAMDLLQFLGGTGMRKVVVTSTRGETARRMLVNAGLMSFFEFVVAGDEISKSKPDPEIYLTACRKLEEAPQDCLALEDSDNGVLSAHTAGLKVVQVPDLFEPSDRVKALGHRIVPSLVDVLKLLQNGATNEG